MLVMAPQKEKKSGRKRKQQVPMSMSADNEAAMCDYTAQDAVPTQGTAMSSSPSLNSPSMDFLEVVEAMLLT